MLDFRADIASRKGPKENTLSPERVNHIMTPLRMILNEAAQRYSFTFPYQGSKSLKVPKTDVQPFTLVGVKQILDTVRSVIKPRV